MVDRLSIAYPARSWPDFTDKLVQIAGLGDTHQELVARLLSSLAEEASSTELSSAMSSQRQSEIMQARPNSLRFFHPCSRHRCDSCFMQGLQTTALSFLTPFRDIIPRELAAFQSTRGMRHLNLCHACIELLGSYSPWLPAADLAAVNIIQIVVALLRMPELQVSMQCVRRECSQSGVTALLSCAVCRQMWYPLYPRWRVASTARLTGTSSTACWRPCHRRVRSSWLLRMSPCFRHSKVA